MIIDKSSSPKRLLYRFGIDLWGFYILQYKLESKPTKKILLNFESVLRYRFFKRLRKTFFFLHQKKKFRRYSSKTNWRLNQNFKKKNFTNTAINTKFSRGFNKFSNQKFKKKNYKKFNKNIKVNSKGIIFKKKYRQFIIQFSIYKKFILKKLINIFKKKILKKKKIKFKNKVKKNFFKKIFFINFFKYSNFYKKKFNIIPSLETMWYKSHLRRLKFIIPKLLWRLNFKYSIRKKLKKSYKKFPSAVFYRKIELIKQQQFFCFSTLSQIKKFLFRVEYSRRPDIIFLGLEGCFLNLVFRTNLFLTTRQVYTFIRLGAFNVNNRLLLSPYKILSVFDIFSVNSSFVKTIWKIFLNKIRKKLILVNIPNYIDFNYKLLQFFIWRLPTDSEKKFTYDFPFFRQESESIKYSSSQKQSFITKEDLIVKPRRFR